MKRIVFLFLMSIAVAALLPSCSKETKLNPTPANYRLTSIKKITVFDGELPNTEIYSIFYNGQEVSEILYTSDDTSIPKTFKYFTYFSDTIVRTDYQSDYVTIIARDTFVVNSNKQIIDVYRNGFARPGHPGWSQQYQLTYLNKLLSQLQIINPYNYGTYYGGTMNYTSFDGDFYKSTSNISLDSVENFAFYGMANRMGDFFQLNSFVLYGQNIYCNAHLAKQITSSGYTTNITYIFDGDSKITQTDAMVSDSVGNTYHYTYKLAYETY
jgi:hypothetical protein